MKMIIRQLCATLAAIGAVSAAPTPPNIVFIMADDLGWSDTTLYGTTELYQTPNIAKLAERGMVFTHAYSASPLCSPTRASLLSGQSPARIGVTAPNCHLPKATTKASRRDSAPPNMKLLNVESATRFDTAHFTLAEALKQQGYATGHFGKWHLGPPPYSPLEQGFDVDIPHTAAPGPPGGFIAPWAYQNGFKERTPGEHIEDRMADEAVAWMEKHKDQPFFLNYWQFSVHAPFDAKKELIEKYRKLVDPSAAQRCAVYAAMVESMDDAVGTLMAALERLGIAERTIIVFYSDNGGNMYNVVEGAPPTSNSPLRGGKATPWEGGVRVPCIIAWPGLIKAGSRNETPIQSEDFYPTFAELLDLKVPQDQIFDGLSIAPVLRGGTLPERPLFRYFPHSPAKVPDKTPPTVTVTLGDWKLMRFFHDGENGAHVHQLYNLREDIGETNDLASQHPEQVERLSAMIDGFLVRTGAVLPMPNPDYRPGTQAAAAPNPLHGWQPRGCTAAVKEGLLQVTPEPNAAPFLGRGAGSMKGAGQLKLKLRAKTAGEVSLELLESIQTANAPLFRSKPVAIAAGDWEELIIEVPASARPANIMRLHLPAAAVEIDWIEWSGRPAPQRWDF
jgi:arylsulfatase A-like enzyme